MKPKLKLYIWTGFQPDYTGGLAVAIAESEREAREFVCIAKNTKNCTWSEDEITWGELEVRELSKYAICVSGG